MRMPLQPSWADLFTTKQIAPDIYTGFSNSVMLANTFIGLNTVRVELGPVDLVRAMVVDCAMQQSWPASDVEVMENKFSNVFTDGKAKPVNDLLPFANALNKCLSSQDNLSPPALFPQWPAIVWAHTPGQNYQPGASVEFFLKFVEECCELADDKETNANSFLVEILRCGKLAFSFALLHYYRAISHGGATPSFLSGGHAEDVDLLLLLRAAYRAALDGSLGRTTSVGLDIISGAKGSIQAIADAINPPLANPMSAQADRSWLVGKLNEISGTAKAQIVFNACLLPTRSSRATSFQPLVYGTKVTHSQIDHLIPKKNLSGNLPGLPWIDTLRNLCPITQPLNKTCSNMLCSQKLAPTGTYQSYYGSQQGSSPMHPFTQWLLSAQGSAGALLDDLGQLVPQATPGASGSASTTPSIGDQRIEELADLLINRL
jgi:hypothetical protein